MHEMDRTVLWLNHIQYDIDKNMLWLKINSSICDTDINASE